MSGKIRNSLGDERMRMSMTNRVEGVRSENPFEDMSDAKAVEAAAQLVRTAAANLISDEGCEDAAWLYVMSQELFKVVERLKRGDDWSGVPSSRLN